MATATIQQVYNAYLAEVAGWSGYTQGKIVPDDKFTPSSVKDKTFFLEFSQKKTLDGGMTTGNTEYTEMVFVLSVYFSYPRKNTFAVNEAATWNTIDTAERQLLDFSNSRTASSGDILNFESIVLEKIEIEPDWRVARFNGRVSWRRSLAL